MVGRNLSAVAQYAPTAFDEAKILSDRLRRLGDAGAFAVEMEVIPAALMTHLTATTGLVTVSLGSGRGGDVSFLFTADICGDGGHIPRHARAYADPHGLRAQINAERLRALTAFRSDVAQRRFPGDAETVTMDTDVLASLQRHGN